ncbi:HD domain-containing protein [Haloactinopolyspora alba]|uniref:HD domain-containing protein n=1 Tax=Haloactinopolyspora alba TaxID=648780 RepID=A0A2P8E7N6_9ACTN|nr:HD domain-containing protein [Haloactinopolyspora alba]PSL05438.1 HD domain-containing protein [Haloactinopolyspora alba]
MTFTLDLPTGPLADAVLRTVRSSETASIANHSVRSFYFSQLLAEHEGVADDAAYDRDLLYAATVMHDLGAGDRAHGEARFEVEGADLAAALLTEYGVDARDVDRVWEAIALHTSPGIAERRGLLAYLTRAGIGIDFGRDADVVADWQKEIHGAYPRLAMARSLTDAIVERAGRSDAAAPRYSLGGELLRERRADGVTALELAVASSPWGE